MAEASPKRRARTALRVALVPFVGIAGIVLGFRARRSVQAELSEGAGAAAAAMALGIGWLVVALGLYLWSSPGAAERNKAGEVTTTTGVNLNDLRVGDCIKDALSDDSSNVLSGNSWVAGATPCAESHWGEVVLHARLAKYPGAAELERTIDDRCTHAIDVYTGSTADLAFVAKYPSPLSWLHGDRVLLCVATSPDGSPRTGRVAKGSGGA